jgi:hypothetical protein
VYCINEWPAWKCGQAANSKDEPTKAAHTEQAIVCFIFIEDGKSILNVELSGKISMLNKV